MSVITNNITAILNSPISTLSNASAILILRFSVGGACGTAEPGFTTKDKAARNSNENAAPKTYVVLQPYVSITYVENGICHDSPKGILIDQIPIARPISLGGNHDMVARGATTLRVTPPKSMKLLPS